MKKFNLHLPSVKADFERIRMLHWGHFSLLVLVLGLQIVLDFRSLWNILTILILVFFYRHFMRTVREVLYTFWFMAFLLMLYFSVGLTKSFFIYDGWSLVVVHLLAMSFLLLEMYALSSPIFFPRVNWWEYDLRYRHELKVDVMKGEQHYEARLSDLRRGAGCLVSFEEFPLGDFIEIKLSPAHQSLYLRGEVVSRRIYSIGRGMIYGLRFHFNSREEKRQFIEFSEKWRSEGNFKTRMKFERLKDKEAK